jgi:Ca2+-binding RTX toxin-like protein
MNIINVSRPFIVVTLIAGLASFAHGCSPGADEPDDESSSHSQPVVVVPMCMGFPATIIGGPGNDTLNGGPGADVIVGMGGDDTIYGGGGNDIICGNDGNDFLDGEGGNDRSNGGPGDDVLADQGGGNDTADYTDSPAATFIRIGNFGGTTNDGWGGTDSMDNIENANGSAFNDAIVGDNGPNIIFGLGGADTMQGNGGADTLTGGAANDTAFGGPGVDVCSAEVLFSCP